MLMSQLLVCLIVTVQMLVVVLSLVQVVVGLSEEITTLLEDLCLSTRTALHSCGSMCALILGNRMQIAFGLAISEVSGVMAAYMLQLGILNRNVAGYRFIVSSVRRFSCSLCC